MECPDMRSGNLQCKKTFSGILDRMRVSDNTNRDFSRRLFLGSRILQDKRRDAGVTVWKKRKK
ncbi:MAG TPA: hypothetical protein PLJ29_18755, partial [Leptospiraceae bacterium]|nr:hypothetical protein [Leptospiraceae bacterium]